MPISIDQWREVRLLATSVAAALEGAGAKFVLVTSPLAGEGKSLLVRALEHEFHAMAMSRFHVMDWKDLERYEPRLDDPHMVVLVDGPPLGEGDGVLRLPADWLQAFDGALVVVKKRSTGRADLQQALGWLKAAGIPPVGVIWNQHGLPPLGSVLRRWRARLFGGSKRKASRDLPAAAAATAAVAEDG